MEIGQFTGQKSGQDQGGVELPLQLLPGERGLCGGEEALLGEPREHLQGGGKSEVIGEFVRRHGAFSFVHKIFLIAEKRGPPGCDGPGGPRGF